MAKKKYVLLKIKKPERIRWVYAFLLMFMILTVYSLLEASIVITDRVTFSDEDIPSSFNGYKIVFISDIHTGLHLNSHSLQDLVQAVNNEAPDCVILGGDYINHKASEFEKVAEGLVGLQAKDGVYGVAGNHDIFYGYEETAKFFSNMHITSVENTSVKIERNGQTIYLSGTEDVMTGKPDMAKALNDIDKKVFNIFITHSPLLFANKEENYYNDKIDLALMGHTHGGQLSFLGLVSLWPDEFADYYRPTVRQKNGLKYIISNGFGTTFLPIRFFCPPQIHVITLRSQ